MQSLDPFRFRRKVRFEPEGAERFLHPERGLRGCSRRDSQRHDARPVERLRRQVLQSRDARAQTCADLRSAYADPLQWQVSEQAQMLAPC